MKVIVIVLTERFTSNEKQYFRVLEVAADWRQLIVLQHIMRPSIACIRVQYSYTMHVILILSQSYGVTD